MSDKKDSPDFSGEQEWIGSFYAVPTNPHGTNTHLARDRKKTSSIDRAHPNDGRL